MAEEVLINVTPRETRVAQVEHGVLQEILIERESHRGLVTNIYKGRVHRVLPGMQAAFIDIGIERTAFLHAYDIVKESNDNNGEDTSISSLLQEGQNLLVQVIKNPLGTKGARLTTQISIPSRYVVFIPNLDTVGISQRITGEERQRLLRIVQEYIDGVREMIAEQGDAGEMPPFGFIIRTAAESVDEEVLRGDMEFLRQVWRATLEKNETAMPASLVYEDFPLVLRTLRDLVNMRVEKIRVDSLEICREMQSFASNYIPELAPIIEHYNKERPIFDLHGIEDEINKALESDVPLKSGGYLIIEQTEAMTTIDVNTGKFVGRRNLEETIFKTNLEAAQTIARQLRLRNLGGIIILDFIDMMEQEHRRQVIRTLEKCLEHDHAKTYISDISNLGLVQMTRKRTRESLEQVLCEPCPVCEGQGTIKSAETICYEIFREIIREANQYDGADFMVLASEAVVDLLFDEESETLARLEADIGRTITIQVESSYMQEQYDIVLIQQKS